MKLHHIHVENLLGARQIDLPITQPITLLAGMNGAGKSSIRDAISLALTAELCRVSKKGEAAALLSEGASAARVFVQTSDRDYEVVISKAGKITDGAAGIEPHPALPFVLDAARFARLTDTERRTMLFGLLGIETSHKAIAERMTRKGLDTKKTEAVLPVLRAGFAAGEKHAKDEASQARGAWKAVTGEAYGDKKADGWAPETREVAGDAVTLAENAEAKAGELTKHIAGLQQELGAAKAAQQHALQHAQRVERLLEQAGMIDRIKARLATAEENAAACRAQLARAGGEDPKAPASYLFRGLAGALNEAIYVIEEEGLRTRCEGLINRASAHLAEYRKLHGDPNAEPAGPARTEEIRRGLATAESGAANALRDLAAAEAAAAELVELEKSPLELPKTADIESRLADAQRRLADWQADARKYREAAGAAERRAKQISDATRHHQDVQQWSAIADALSPNGIQAEMIAEALDPLNRLLSEHAALAQWQPVRIGADMGITAGGRDYRLCSESEKWRADALLTVAIAVLSGLRFAVLDRMDVLDVTGREDALYWLSEIAEAGDIDTVIVLATLKSAPPAAALPAHIASHWIERGTLIQTNELAREAA
ncbi:AAA family ATPase [Parazoarcus communis]|uniref:Recombinase RecF n=1 Tax=Parazoarcus communis SWub3 = DSM 12120 TaxID=1121029 RepID=A0A323UUL5_9RHOO|nr:ATP-binding protein [Parazoarcus communis]NMG70336.1 AAA family ATPase [Parazoarcus communis SWub3 = DSM 12120]PZA16107.1 recombinase RecF [Azoarcus communis] [Parazoarcus communis SWub3 = DSM 12120]